MVIVSKFDLQIQLNPIKIPAGLFAEIDKPVLKFTWKFKGPQIAKTILKRGEKSLRTHTSQFQNFLQSYDSQDSAILA